MITARGWAVLICGLCLAAGTALAADWHVATNGNDAADGASWATAKRTIQVAVDAAASNDTVWVSNGVYATGGVINYPAGSTQTNRVAIYKPITVQSVNGPEVTIIQGAWDPVTTNGDAAVRCVYVGSYAVLSGFTLTNGATQWLYSFGFGGGAYCEASGVLNHCTLIGNSACEGGGVFGGTLNFCTLTGNRANVDHKWSMAIAIGGGASGSTLNDCLLNRNYAGTESGGAYQCTLNRCRLIQNQADFAGGGAGGGMLNNCLVVGNSAAYGGGTASSTLNNCTVVSNTSGGVRWGTINNGIYYGNEGGANPESGPIFCNTFRGDPLFVDATAGDFRLRTNSPCINAGSNIYVQGETDLDGNPRIVNGMVDQGAYEIQLAGYWAWAAAITNGQTNDTDCAAGDGVPNLLKYAVGSPDPMVPDDLATLGLKRGSVPTLVFHRNPKATDVQWLIEGADAISNGATWRGLATNIDGSWGGATNVDETGTENPVVCTVADPFPLQTNRFLRLKVTRP